MSAEAQAALFFLAFACFVAAAVLSIRPRVWPAVLVAAGLASWVFVAFYTAFKAT